MNVIYLERSQRNRLVGTTIGQPAKMSGWVDGLKPSLRNRGIIFIAELRHPTRKRTGLGSRVYERT